jgi:uncharacterized membrane protein YhhN
MGAVGLIGLIAITITGHIQARVIWKALASVGFVICALEQGVSGRYGTLVLAGLAFGFVGDVLLGLRGRRPFLAGMIAFALGHGLYAVAFASLRAAEPFPGVSIALIGLIACGTLAWLWPHLGRMRVPVAVYVGTLILDNPARWLVALGAALFAVSDVFVARERFVTAESVNQFLGLPLYYAAQFLIAFSVASFPVAGF